MKEALNEQILRENPTKEKAYHGNKHMIWVARTAIELARREGVENEGELANLESAGLAHDYNHGGYANDVDNVRQTIDSLSEKYDIDDETLRIVRATTWPHSEPSDELEAIIQDADILYSSPINEDFDKVADEVVAEGNVPDMEFVDKLPGWLNTRSAKEWLEEVK